jgi:ATP phosphoribosyltransferase regulatory subunit
MKYLQQEEKIITNLTALYEGRGYKKYKPSFCEEYALYLENRDFLISKSVITFSGAGGKLYALRPDVTLSILTHSKADKNLTEKLFYNEKVYRLSADSKEYKEISQTGVEIIGKIDDVCQAEIVMLCLETLSAVSENYLLDISHMGYTEGLISSFNLSVENKSKVYGYLRNKNLHDFEKFAESVNLSAEQISAFKGVTEICGNAEKAIKEAKKLAINKEMKDSANELEQLINTLTSLGYGDKININFSIANNADYYNGVIFNGYIEGVPRSVLSGGRYDKLPQKLGKDAQAIGFALYLGELERYFKWEKRSVDYMVVYDDKTQNEALKIADKKIKDGQTIRLVLKGTECDIPCDNILDLTDGGKENA